MTPRDDDKSESDVDSDEKVASSRDAEGADDGTYVGQVSSDDSLDTEESGAEARSEQGGD